MKIVYRKQAAAHLQAIKRHIAKDNPDAASRVMVRIKASCERLLLFPHSGRKGTVAGTQELVVPGLPYIVVYLVEPELIDILAVFHGAQQEGRTDILLPPR